MLLVLQSTHGGLDHETRVPDLEERREADVEGGEGQGRVSGVRTGDTEGVPYGKLPLSDCATKVDA